MAQKNRSFELTATTLEEVQLGASLAQTIDQILDECTTLDETLARMNAMKLGKEDLRRTNTQRCVVAMFFRRQLEILYKNADFPVLQEYGFIVTSSYGLVRVELVPLSMIEAADVIGAPADSGKRILNVVFEKENTLWTVMQLFDTDSKYLKRIDVVDGIVKILDPDPLASS